MSTLTLTATNECAGQNHFDLTVTGDVQYTTHTELGDLTKPLTEEEKDAFIKVLIRVGAIGRSRNQVRNTLANGWTVTI